MRAPPVLEGVEIAVVLRAIWAVDPETYSHQNASISFPGRIGAVQRLRSLILQGETRWEDRCGGVLDGFLGSRLRVRERRSWFHIISASACHDDHQYRRDEYRQPCRFHAR